MKVEKGGLSPDKNDLLEAVVLGTAVLFGLDHHFQQMVSRFVQVQVIQQGCGAAGEGKVIFAEVVAVEVEKETGSGIGETFDFQGDRKFLLRRNPGGGGQIFYQHFLLVNIPRHRQGVENQTRSCQGGEGALQVSAVFPPVAEKDDPPVPPGRQKGQGPVKRRGGVGPGSVRQGFHPHLLQDGTGGRSEKSLAAEGNHSGGFEIRLISGAGPDPVDRRFPGGGRNALGSIQKVDQGELPSPQGQNGVEKGGGGKNKGQDRENKVFPSRFPCAGQAPPGQEPFTDQEKRRRSQKPGPKGPEILFLRGLK